MSLRDPFPTLTNRPALSTSNHNGGLILQPVNLNFVKNASRPCNRYLTLIQKAFANEGYLHQWNLLKPWNYLTDSQWFGWELLNCC